MLTPAHFFQNARRFDLLLEAFEGLFKGFSLLHHNFGHAYVTSFQPMKLMSHRGGAHTGGPTVRILRNPRAKASKNLEA
jgi:hypothetical protein